MKIPTIVAVLLAAFALALAGCKGDTGSAGAAGSSGATGPAGPAGTSVGTVSGTVTNALNTAAAVAGAAVTTNPSAGTTITTDSSGKYTVDLPVGSYAFTYTKTNFTTGTQAVSVTAGKTVTANIALTPTQPVAVSAGSTQSAAPGTTVSLTGTVTSLDGSSTTGITYAWVQTAGTPVVNSSSAPIALGTTLGTSLAPTVTLGSDAQYKANLFAVPTASDNASEYHGPTDRLMVEGIAPSQLENAEVATFKLTATMPDGTTTYSATVNVDSTSTMPYVVSTGLQNVPLGLPVVIRGKSGSSYSWSITNFTPVTSGASSSPTVGDAATQYPYFMPDTAGTYTLTDANNAANTIKIYAAAWSNGLIGSIGTDTFPNMGSNCNQCHKATATGNALDVYNTYLNWRKTGHAGIFSQNLNTSTHYGTSCFTCHTVGYNTSVANNGFDDTTEYSNWLNNSGLFNVTSSGSATVANANASNWSNTVTNYPTVAAKANIQCENCHGPNGPNADDPLHNNGTLGDSGRVSWSSDVCASCHGELTRHARWQQWLQAGHSNYSLAEARAAVENSAPSATSYGAGDCGRCHSGQGFVAWVEDAANNSNVLGNYVPTSTYSRTGTDPLTNASGYTTELTSLGLTTAAVVPQTCQTCHDPHTQGRTAYIPNTATVRVSGDTDLLPAGYTAYGVGRGAVCITCHNTRNGAHNDTLTPDSTTYAAAGEQYGGPHHGAQGDVLMGENAYFVSVGDRSPHSYLPDTCTKCHMELSPAPAGTFNPTEPGTNHQFNASTTICSNCHGSAFTPDSSGQLPIQKTTTSMLTLLSTKIGTQMYNDISNVTTPAGTTKYIGLGTNSSGTLSIASAVKWSDVTAASKVAVGSYHGEPAGAFTTSTATTSIPTGEIVVWFDNNTTGTVGSYDSGDTAYVLYPVANSYGIGSSNNSGTGTFVDSLALNSSSVTVSTAANTRTLVEAMWNYSLIDSDLSGGVHNPGFVNDVMSASIAKFPTH